MSLKLKYYDVIACISIIYIAWNLPVDKENEDMVDNNIDTIEKEDRFTILDEPVNVIYPYAESYILLVAALDSGWQVKEPIRLSPSELTKGKLLSQFRLKQPLFREVCFITCYWTPEIEQFVNKHGWRIDRTNLQTKGD